MRTVHICVAALSIAAVHSAALAQLANFDAETEGFHGQVFSSGGLLFNNCNNVSGFYPDGQPFTPEDIGRTLIIEDSTLAVPDFPAFISAPNTLTFGNAFIAGPNLSLGALATVTMAPAQPATQASFDLIYYENGPWGGIQVTLDALLNGQVVNTTGFAISNNNPGGRDNVTATHLSIAAPSFDSIRLYARLNGDYTTMRALVDNVSMVPTPASLLPLALMALARRRRR